MGPQSVLLLLTSIAEEHKALVFGDLHLLLRQLRNNQLSTREQCIRIRDLLLIGDVDIYPAIGVIIVLACQLRQRGGLL